MKVWTAVKSNYFFQIEPLQSIILFLFTISYFAKRLNNPLKNLFDVDILPKTIYTINNIYISPLKTMKRRVGLEGSQSELVMV